MLVVATACSGGSTGASAGNASRLSMVLSILRVDALCGAGAGQDHGLRRPGDARSDDNRLALLAGAPRPALPTHQPRLSPSRY